MLSEKIVVAEKSLSTEKPSSLAEILRQRAIESPDRIAYSFLSNSEVSDSLTYQELHLRATAIAQALLDRGTNGRVLLVYPQGLEFIAAFLGCLYANLIAVPVYPPKPNRPDLRLAAIVADSQAQLALTTAQIAADVALHSVHQAELADLQWLATDGVVIGTPGELVGPPPFAGDESVAYLQYTSGSTSTPKGVIVTHRSLLYTLEDLHRGWHHTSDSVMVSWLPLFHDMGLIYGMLQSLYKGFPCYLMDPAAFVQRPLRWLEAISRFRGTHSAAPNFAFDLCVRRITEAEKSHLDLTSWQVVLNAAEPVREETQRSFVKAFASCGFRPRTFCPGYGLAECTLKVTAVRRGDGHKTLHVKADALLQGRIEPAGADVANARVLVGCGRSEIGARIAIVDPETRIENPPNQVGEVWVSSDSVAQGYWQRPAATLETFGARIADTNEGPFLRTGDLGFIVEGELFLTGRIKDMIIIRGANHYPQDIELTAERSHPHLRPGCCAAFSVPEFSVDDRSEESLVVVQEVKPAALNAAEWDRVIRDIREAVALNHSLTPYAVVLVKASSIPKTSSGKIQRRTCRQTFLTGGLEQVAEWRQKGPRPSDDNGLITAANDPLQQTEFIERWLVRKLAPSAGLEPSELDLDEPFTKLGIDSLAAVRLSGELESLLGRTLPTTLLFEHSTPRALASFLAVGTLPQTSRPSPGTPVNSTKIAIIGLACRVAGARDAKAFWQMLCDGVDNAGPPPPSRGFGDCVQPGYFLDGIDLFDPAFFSLSPREAENMDPQQRLLLEVAWEALENAGQANVAGSATGVFVGISSSDYLRMLLGSTDRLNAYCGTGGAMSIAANRLSYLFDLRGPSWAVDTACSSSLVAVHQACQSLKLGECDMALASGINLMLAPELTVVFEKAQMLSGDGRCKTFDAAADGYGRGEGCGVVVLKRHADALRDGDTILALIAGSAVNQDGRSNGLTAPNGQAQQEVVRLALRQAGVAPADVSYVETHGTGTPLGDPIEVNALKAVLSDGRLSNRTCWLGSVKPNIGHLEAAAGITGLIKTVLALQHRQLPPQLHFKQLNPHIDLSHAALAISSRQQPWQSDGIRVAGVSSFGFGGTNAHVILCEAEPSAPQANTSKDNGLTQLLTLSAKQVGALAELTQSYRKHLDEVPEQALPDVCFSANTGRAAFRHRLAIVAESADAMRQCLADVAEGNVAEGKGPAGAMHGEVLPSSRLNVAFLFSGQGSQYPEMGRELYTTQPVFRRSLEECNALLNLTPSLLDVLYGASIDASEHQALLDQTAYTQPALFALEYALAQLWRSWGITPSALIGHSLGEYVAACIAGVFSLEDGLRLVAERGRLMAAAPGRGAMAAVFASEARVRALLESCDAEKSCAVEVQIAALNGPTNTVISGASDSVGAAHARFEAAGLRVKRLATSHAFHSTLMEPIADEFERVLETVRFAMPRIPLISNVTGVQASAEITSPAYWRRHLLEPVRFAAGINTLSQLGCNALLEIGPNPVLLELAQQCLRDSSPPAFLPSLRRNRPCLQTALSSLADLYVRGARVDWHGVYQGQSRHRVDLPTYPFQRQRYWLREQPAASTGNSTRQGWHYALHWRNKPRSPFPGLSLVASNSGTWLVFVDANGVGERLTNALESTGHICWRVYSKQPIVPLAPTGISTGIPRSIGVDPRQPDQVRQAIDRVVAECAGNLVGVAYLWCLADGFIPDGLEQAQQLGCDTPIGIVRALEHHRVSARLWGVTRGTAAIDPKRHTPPGAQDLLNGIAKVIALEYPGLWGGMVDLAAKPEADESSQLALELLDAEGEDQLAFRNGQRFVARLAPAGSPQSPPTQLDPNASYLIVGGLGVLGLKTAQWMVRQGARQLVLTARRPPDSAASRTIRALESLGAEVLIVSTDIADETSVSALFRAIAPLAPLKGIVHAAGEADSRMIKDIDPASPTAGALAAKAAGSWLLHQQSLHLDLDFFVSFSSIASVLGAHGNAYYAAANQFLDALAYYRQGMNLPAVSINWGPWDGGMATDEYRRQLLRFGVRALPIDDASTALEGMLSAELPQVIIADVDWKVFAEHLYQPLLAELAPSHATTRADATPSLFRQRLAKATRGERHRILVEHLQTELARILGFPASQKIDPRRGFFDLGMESIAALELRNHLQKLLGESLPATLAFEMPHLESLAAYLVELVSPADTKAAPPAEAETRDAQLSEIRELSEQELERFLNLEFEKAML